MRNQKLKRIYYQEFRAILCAYIQNDGLVLRSDSEGSRTLYDMWLATNCPWMIARRNGLFYLMHVQHTEFSKKNGSYTNQYQVFGDLDTAIAAGVLQST